MREIHFEIERIHNYFDKVLLDKGIHIKKSTLESNDEECTHDSAKKCRVCGCDWLHACHGGCYWVEDDLCSCCVDKIQYKREKEGATL